MQGRNGDGFHTLWWWLCGGKGSGRLAAREIEGHHEVGHLQHNQLASNFSGSCQDSDKITIPALLCRIGKSLRQRIWILRRHLHLNLRNNLTQPPPFCATHGKALSRDVKSKMKYWPVGEMVSRCFPVAKILGSIPRRVEIFCQSFLFACCLPLLSAPLLTANPALPSPLPRKNPGVRGLGFKPNALDVLTPPPSTVLHPKVRSAAAGSPLTSIDAGLAQLGERQTEVKLREVNLKVVCSIHTNRNPILFGRRLDTGGLWTGVKLRPPLKCFVQSTGNGFELYQLSFRPLYLSFALFPLFFFSFLFLSSFLSSFLFCLFVFVSEREKEKAREKVLSCQSRGKTFDISLYHDQSPATSPNQTRSRTCSDSFAPTRCVEIESCPSASKSRHVQNRYKTDKN